MKKTLRFEATLTISPVYAGRALMPDTNGVKVGAIGLAWQEAATKVFELTGIYIDAVINSSRALGKIGLECSYGGNPAFTFSGSLKPVMYDAEEWKKAVILVVKELKELLHNSSITVDFWEVTHEVIH